MVKHSPNDRLCVLQQQQQQQQQQAQVHPNPAQPAPDNLPSLLDDLPPVGEALRRAAEVRREADELERKATADRIEVATDDNALPLPLHPNVSDRRRRLRDEEVHPEDLQDGVDGDGDDLGASFMGDEMPSTPPPWLSQVINAAVTAAAAAVAAMPQRSQPQCSSLAPTKLSDRKVPDFWESKPEEWFRIFDAHLAYFKPSQDASFNTLLPLLTPAALSKMTPILRVPGPTPYTAAKTALLKHFAKTPRDLARELRELRSLGDSTPSEILAHIRGLLPDPDVLFEVVLLDLLPSNARDAALQHSTLDAMAAAADLIVAENQVAASLPAVSAISSEASSDGPSQALPVAAAITSSPDLCPVHARYGRAAYRCANPASCRMKNVIRQRPSSSASSSSTLSPASGNSRAGGRS